MIYIVDFEQANVSWDIDIFEYILHLYLVFLLLTLNK